MVKVFLAQFIEAHIGAKAIPVIVIDLLVSWAVVNAHIPEHKTCL